MAFCILLWLSDISLCVCVSYLLFNIFIIFNWRVIALQYCVGFHHTAAWISHSYTYAPPSWASLPPSTPSHPSRLFQSTSLSSLSHSSNFHWLSILHMVMCIDIPHLYLSVSDHLNCFHVLAIVNRVVMNIVVHVSFWMPRFGIARSNGNSILF